ncbi:hypothetical protein PRUPE_3G021200 [Prunus persica]|uniref:Uncharacterized protein n=1 Tax=Prunus persica TaxID=3760 RepID=A0A251PTX6_PRUPE|nr:hypothetical protein PRUPE_3G021200 [Prunus persica]
MVRVSVVASSMFLLQIHGMHDQLRKSLKVSSKTGSTNRKVILKPTLTLSITANVSLRIRLNMRRFSCDINERISLAMLFLLQVFQCRPSQ